MNTMAPRGQGRKHIEVEAAQAHQQRVEDVETLVEVGPPSHLPSLEVTFWNLD